ncbi:MAG: ribosome maturation factor RimP [Deltaproteobacteria bacterium]|nr:ribosome maturation factor RimP [Deltaproteobacteria bacterium]
MHIYEDQIRKLIEPVVEAEGMELVHLDCLRMKTRWLVRIYLDKEGGITIEDCSEMSHLIGDILDVNDIPRGPYTLEVSSPGLDRPLSRDKDFLKYRGHRVKITTVEKLQGMKHFKGEIVDFLEEDDHKVLVIDVEGKIYRIPRALVQKARLEYVL